MTESSIEIGAMSNRGKLLALVAGPILGLLTYFLLPESYINSQGVETAFPYAGRACMGVTVWMAIWWFTEALPIAATAMIPLVVYPLLQITSAKVAMSNYASGTIFLFLGGFLLAAGIHRWHLDRRIALLTLRLFGTQPKQMVLGLMLATAGLSAWVSNTATAAMMVPIAIAVLGVVRSTQKSEVIGKDERNFGIAVLLSIAYAASIGGMVTVIGSPPNGIYVRFMEQTYGETVSFIDWLKIGLPVALLLLPATYFLLVNVLFPCKMEGIPGGKDLIENTGVHPESYDAARALLKHFSLTPAEAVGKLLTLADAEGFAALAKQLNVGEPTLRDIAAELSRPGRDPRDELPQVLMRSDVMDLKDLQPGMELRGTVRNVTDFGAFVDIGVHRDGLVHISQMAQRRVNHPSEVVRVGDIVTVWVLEADAKTNRISLTMRPPAKQ